LEEREAPQLLPGLALTAAVGMPFLARAVQASVANTRPAPVSQVEVPQAGRESAAPGTRVDATVQQSALILAQCWQAGTAEETDLAAPLPDAALAAARPEEPGAANAGAFAAVGGESAGTPAGGPAAFTEPPPAPADQGGGDSPALANKTATAAAPASTPGTPAGLGHAPAASPPTVPAAALPAAATPTDLTALAHGLAQPTAPPRHQGPQPPSSGMGLLVTGPDAGSAPQVNVYNPTTSKLLYSFMAYDPSFTGGVRVAVAQVNPADPMPNIITAPGPGGGSLIKIWNGATGALEQSFNAYGPGQTDGVFVAAGDINGDGYADIICGTDVGAKPVVNVYSGKDLSLLSSFLADPEAGPNGVRVAAANFGNNYDDIVTGAGPGGPPRVTVVDGLTGQQVSSYFAFPENFTGGIYVAAGNLGGTGQDDLIASEGGGGTPVVNLFDATLHPVENFLAYPINFSGGARLAVADLTGTGQLDVATAQGPGGGQLAGFDGQLFQPVTSLNPYGDSYTGGFFVAGDGQPHPSTSSGQSHTHTFSGPLPPDPPTITLSASATAVFDQANNSVTFTATRTGSTTNALAVSYTHSGTGLIGTDYTLGPSGSMFSFGSGQSTATVTLGVLDDAGLDSKEEVVLSLAPGSGYTIGTPSSAQVEIEEIPVTPPTGCGCSGQADLVGQASGVAADPTAPYSAGTVDYWSGVVKVGATQISTVPLKEIDGTFSTVLAHPDS
jgi:hypothetical protein